METTVFSLSSSPTFAGTKWTPHSSILISTSRRITAVRFKTPIDRHCPLRQKRSCAIRSSSAVESTPPQLPSERWLLEPIGDGDYRHIGYPVNRPGAFEIASNSVTVGRVPEKADIVIPVATVSAVHARLEKKDGQLLVTDLDSTNGTFVEEFKVTPGNPAAVPPGSRITFGDTNLAMFRVTKIEVEDISEAVETNSETVPPTE